MAFHAIHGLVIRTEHVFPPIPDRRFDWSAVADDSYDGEGSLVGTGATEQDAIEDLLEQIDEATDADIVAAGRAQ